MRRLAAVLLTVCVAGCAGASPSKDGPADADLQGVADRIIAALRARNTDVLVALQSPELAAPIAPGDQTYCWLFDSSCIQWGQRRSVRDFVTGAKELRVKATVFSVDHREGHRHGIIEIFDADSVDERRLRETDYFCKRWGHDVLTWTFVDRGTGWQSRGELFDDATDVHCPPGR